MVSLDPAHLSAPSSLVSSAASRTVRKPSFGPPWSLFICVSTASRNPTNILLQASSDIIAFDSMFGDHVAISHSLHSSPQHRLAYRRLIRRAAWLGGQFGGQHSHQQTEVGMHESLLV
ncbi:hypothetical protein HYQ44_019617 [Verticillium longisporum]|nr:hypothetical protein HYQ44_019617 [Verticillium longisporum]